MDDHTQTVPVDPADAELAAWLADLRSRMLAAIGDLIVGQAEALDLLLVALLCRGHCLIEGVPGLAKTAMVQSLARTLDMPFGRIQFTPDLMPADITGGDIIQEDPESGRRQFEFMPGPLFASVVLADEINRAPPKTQAALLEAMQEGRVTVRGRGYELPDPFLVLATRNPIEQEGTYPLPEAQLDRFMFMIRLDYPRPDEEVEVLRRTTATAMPVVSRVLSREELVRLQTLVRGVPVPEPVFARIVRLLQASRPGSGLRVDDASEWLQWGAGPRAGQMLVLGAKAMALLAGRFHVAVADIESLARPVLRHRLVPTFAAQAEGIAVDLLVDRLVAGTRGS